MMRRLIWALVAVAGLGTLATFWFFENFERVPKKHWESPQKEARRNSFLATERLFSHLQRPIDRIRSPKSLDAMTPNGTLILAANRHRLIDRQRANRLLQWVEAGGYLIVEAERAGTDPLLERLGVSRYKKPPAPPQPEGEKKQPVAKKTPANPPVANVVLSDQNIRYRLIFHGNGLIRQAERAPASAWRAGPSEEESSVIHLAWGKGQITVFDSLHFLHFRQIAKEDHAELIWALVQHYQPRGAIHLAARMDFQTLWQWLAESAWMALISGIVLILLWLWRIVPRFGGMQQARLDERRDLAQHLHAIGRSLWREGGLAHLREIVRQSVLQRLALRHPRLARQTRPKQHRALARLAGYSQRDINAALSSAAAPTPDTFTKAMRILQRLERKL
ncbi:DUF4350 domain-containing protein [Propionivibrio limicola]|uniref:DUF4350 domain-containing protein n=1 Tax=Propionivibrio limicola TaxID=167645 RepID=UPI0012920A8C|nr:DUF4350 domain-containing protein [Propionivibrio limicola]